MIYKYDQEVDILTIRFEDSVQPGDIADSEEFSGGLVAEYGTDGNLLQLELRDLRKVVSGEAIVQHRRAA